MSRRVFKKRVFTFVTATLFIIAAILIFSSISGFASTKASDNTSAYKYYTSIAVEKGDTLWSIASKYMTGEYSDVDDYINEVKYLNHLDSNGIYAGEYLTIPYYSSELL